MTVGQWIEKMDLLRPNAYSLDQKTAWVEELEQGIWTQTLLQDPFAAGQTGPDRPLLLPDRWQGLYEAYLTARLDFANGEYSNYANSVELYNERQRQLDAWWAQNRRPADRPAAWVLLGRYTFDDQGKKELRFLEQGQAVLCVRCRVDEAFNGEEFSLSLGTSEEPEALMDSELTEPDQEGSKVVRRLWAPGGRVASICAWGSFQVKPTAGCAVFTALVQPAETAP